MINFTHNNIIKEYLTIDSSIKFIHYFENETNKLIAFSTNPKCKKAMFHFRFKSIEQLESYLNEQLQYWNKAISDKLEYKRKNKENAKAEFEAVKIGDLFYSCWGYEQTNVDFYQVIDKKSGFLILQEINGKRVETRGYDSYGVIAVKGSFKGEPFKKKINGHGNIKLNSYANAYKYVEGDILNETKYY